MREGAVDSQRGKENCIELYKDPEYGKENSHSRFNCRTRGPFSQLVFTNITLLLYFAKRSVSRKVKFGETLLKT